MYVCRGEVDQNQMCAFFSFLGAKSLKTSLAIFQNNEGLTEKVYDLKMKMIFRFGYCFRLLI